MTLFLSFRTRDVGGPAVSPSLLEGPPDGPLLAVPPQQVAARLSGQDLLFVAHGFNVSGRGGARRIGRLDAHLALPPPALVVGLLWPGDAWLPIVDYPAEAAVAEQCGRHLAAFCNSTGAGARSRSFLSHSLGARLVLEAVAGLDVPAASVCLAAAAVDRDCLAREFAAAAANCGRIAVLASRQDWVLKLAYPAGDPLSDLLRGDGATLRAALGHSGPAAPLPPHLGIPVHIPNNLGYGHGDYMPPAEAAPAATANSMWPDPAGFMRRAFLGQPQPWPPA